ncbi:hypothetical protein J5N97_009934 [Dioscorea zingiberensis]|uniref:FLZ-type domain-containing protein n=1 Tax=Dioscorea zingiberensis TaxID=325984 RepID=A0A9D5HM45_9LILI|nr:hypothetical protein J5N97_009934 [Dioscorea zingiberensis]
MSDNIQNPKKLLSSSLSPSPSSSLDSEAATSPTSILELPKAFSSNITRTTPCRYPSLLPNWDINNVGTKAAGLGIVEALLNNIEESDEKYSSINPDHSTRRILLSTKLKVKLPSSRTSSSLESLSSPIEFGIKTKEMQLALYYNSSPAHPTSNTTTVPKSLFTGSLSPREMELSEDYTRVTIHGPNPKTTHIFDNCIIESYRERSFASKKSCYEDNCKPPMLYPSDKFLSHCGTCKKSLSLGQDIFIYKGEKAFCTQECRSEWMLKEDDEDEEGAEKGLDEYHGNECFFVALF